MNCFWGILITSLLLITSCTSIDYLEENGNKTRPQRTNALKHSNFNHLILAAEHKANPAGRKILAIGRKMALIDKVIITGSCWDYANEIYNRAGYPNHPKKRYTVFKGKKKGPYANIYSIQSGDFLYYINHSYGDVEHSAIFVDWLDYHNKHALMLSYGGENRRKPARYKSYKLSSVFRIIRAKDK